MAVYNLRPDFDWDSEGIKEVRKRDGRIVAFDATKITKAIAKAAEQDGLSRPQEIALLMTSEVIRVIGTDFPQFTTPHVENIQDVVIKVLKENDLGSLADTYLTYRENRTKSRAEASNLLKQIGAIIKESPIGIEGNANVGHNFSAKLLQIASAASKWYYENELLPTDIAKAHKEGYIHIHDLDSYGKTLNCMQIPLDKLLKNGFSTGYGFIRPPKRIGSAAALMCIIMQSSQNDMYGGQSIPWMDKSLAKFVDQRYDDLLGSDLTDEETQLKASITREVYQAMEATIHNLNTMHSRAGSQVPFSSVNLGTDLTPRGRLITEQFLKAFYAGLGRGETPIFPNVVFRLKTGVNFNPEDPNYDLYQLALKVAGRRMNPTFSFMDSSMNKPFGDKTSYMGCRSRLIDNIYGESTSEARGSIAPVSINLPKLALESEGSTETFFEKLDQTLALCKKQLLHRVEVLKQRTVSDIPFVMGEHLYMGSDDLSPNQSIWEAMKHGSINIGFIGLAEALILLTGKHHGESDISQELGLAIVSHIRAYCDDITDKEKLNCTCYATPAEGLSGRFIALDKKEFGTIPQITDKDYYTNSFHIPVNYQISAFNTIALEGPYHKYCNAGHISYVEVESPLENNPKALESLHRKMAASDMGYAGVNFPIDECVDCAYSGIVDNECPVCGSTRINRVRRVTGYLSYLHRFTTGKKAEYKNRQPHKKA
ncbi:MAG: anaerobic ribonucleoside-triphosphate reductase [Firmicutes bacterium]|nr:anaerobic ribonucleoside-triphosphate reductase [Bacillota bacterium]